MEFRKDISELRTKHPEWRYAPLKQMETEHIEPMPSRLRPRDKLKKKVQYRAMPFLLMLCRFSLCYVISLYALSILYFMSHVNSLNTFSILLML